MDYIINEHAKRAFLSAGDKDEFGVILAILSEIFEDDSPCRQVLDLTGVECEVMIGRDFDVEYIKKLQDLSSKHETIFLNEKCEDLTAIMHKCDFAVASEETMLYSLCSVGVPTVVFSTSDGEALVAKRFDDNGAAKYAGDARTDKRLVQKIVTWGTAAVDNPGFRSRMSSRAREAVKGMNL
ncbi:hypothetical protein [Butyrivibrio sp. YAB3001]|uniref:hypothetical protein n=1 Tax=Butyrivibrio sp. YAB3001 TaxID=1520812 RepID=UPI0008F6233D|nr:hypothetical protein [Butyrivibrio sp. YAB3001]SFC16912.1 hypothetical protein SAMN02910398_01628 [Butyrivibrio sp. YAB3001]